MFRALGTLLGGRCLATATFPAAKRTFNATKHAPATSLALATSNATLLYLLQDHVTSNATSNVLLQDHVTSNATSQILLQNYGW